MSLGQSKAVLESPPVIAQQEPFGGVLVADNFPGADWGAKVQAADTMLGTASGEIWMSLAAGTSAPAKDVTLNSGHVLRFTQGGTWNLGTSRIVIPAGASKTALLCDVPSGAKLQYKGSDFAIVIGAAGTTLTTAVTIKGIFIACQSSVDNAGCIHALCTLFVKVEDCELACNVANKQYGILSDGTGDFSAYMTLFNTTINLAYYGVKYTGSSNSNVIIGGSITGPSTPLSGSSGVNVDAGDSCNFVSLDIENYDTGLLLNSARTSVTCIRFEGNNTACEFSSAAASNTVFCINTSGTITVTNNGAASNNFYYSDQTLAIAGVTTPQIVFSHAYTGITANDTSHEAVFNPALAGRYRVSAILYVTSTGVSGSTMTVQAMVQNGNFAGPASSAVGNTSLNRTQGVDTYEYTNGGSGSAYAMGYKTTLTGTIGTAVYAVILTVEYLGT